MISQIMIQLSNTTKSEKYQQEKVQQVIFTGTASAAVRIYYILVQSKETILEFSKGTTKVFYLFKWLNIVKRMLNYQILN